MSSNLNNQIQDFMHIPVAVGEVKYLSHNLLMQSKSWKFYKNIDSLSSKTS